MHIDIVIKGGKKRRLQCQQRKSDSYTASSTRDSRASPTVSAAQLKAERVS